MRIAIFALAITLIQTASLSAHADSPVVTCMNRLTDIGNKISLALRPGPVGKLDCRLSGQNGNDVYVWRGCPDKFAEYSQNYDQYKLTVSDLFASGKCTLTSLQMIPYIETMAVNYGQPAKDVYDALTEIPASTTPPGFNTDGYTKKVGNLTCGQTILLKDNPPVFFCAVWPPGHI